MDMSQPPLVLGISGPDQQDLDQLSCSDFAVVVASTASTLPQVLDAHPRQIFAVILTSKMTLSSLSDWTSALASEERMRELPIVALIDDNPLPDVRDLLRRVSHYVLQGESSVADQRTMVNAAREEFRASVQLKRELASRTSAIGQIISGRFEFKTREQAQHLATMLSMTCPEPVPIAVGLSELLINAVEHGTLEIGYEEKSRLIEAGTLADAIKDRRIWPEYRDRVVSVDFKRTDQSVWFRVEDAGPGFDYANKLSALERPHTEKHGRGIDMAEHCFDEVVFEGRGNIVIASKVITKTES